MPGDWSRAEVEATVTDYFAMLQAELRGQSYNKTDHRRARQALVADRSDTAIERKHMNISAVLRDCGHPWIDGYKPYGNYQQLLAVVVADRLAVDRALVDLVENEVSLPASAPAIASLLGIWEPPPEPDSAGSAGVGEAAVTPYNPVPGVHKDYLAIEAANHSLGRAGEELVLQYEAQRLHKAGADRLAGKIEHVSVTKGDGLGFDVLSFEADGQERLIEVKTTSFGKRTPFFVSQIGRAHV